MTASGCGEEEAAALLEASGNDTRTALVMALCAVDRETAEKLLTASGGHIRRAVEAHESDK